jgi:drug/metabolite transporter (DMT)-like permease
MWLVLAVSVAIVYGVRAILFHWSSRQGLDRNVLLLGAYLGAFLLSIALNGIIDQAWNKGALFGIWIGAFAFVSNSSMYKGYATGKASLIAILIGTSPLVVTTLSYLLWGETLSMGQGLAFVIILAGVFLISYSNDISWRQLKGAQWGLLAMLFFGMTDIICKLSVIEGAETLPTLILMFGTGAILFLGNWYWDKKKGGRLQRKQGAAVEASEGAGLAASGLGWSGSRTLAWGMIVGLTNFAAMMFILPAFKLGVTGLVSAIISANVLLVVLYARLVLKERMARAERCGMVLILGGVIMIKLFT